MVRLLDVEKFTEELPEVKTPLIIHRKHFHPEGLFSEQIFGPLKNYTCQCGKYWGKKGKGNKCDMCGVDIVNNIERRRRYAKIVLPIPVINPLFFDLFLKIIDNPSKKMFKSLLKDHTYKLITSEDYLEIVEDTYEIKEGEKEFYLHDAIEELFNIILNELAVPEHKNHYYYNFFYKNKDKLFLKEVIVNPPEMRPASSLKIKKNKKVVDEINRFFVQILLKKERIESIFIDIKKDKKLYFYFFQQLQKDINELYNFIFQKLSKKEGLIRGNILGKRIDFSGRATIVPDTHLKLNECSIPYFMFLELFKSQITKRLIELNYTKTLNEAIDFINEVIRIRSSILFKICKEIAKNEYCILNRQPSLHKFSMLGFNIVLNSSEDYVIRLNPLVCYGFNADFDGDQMAIYIPLKKASKMEIKEKLLADKNLINPFNLNIIPLPEEDIILGIYLLTSGRIKKYSDIKKFKDIKMHKGLYLFNLLLPNNYKPVTDVIDKKTLYKIISDISYKYGNKTTVRFLENIKTLGFECATLYGATMSLSDVDSDALKEKNELIYEDEDFFKRIENFQNPEVKNILKDYKYSYYVESGSRGSWDQIQQVLLTRGFISDFKGNIKPEPIKNSLLYGLNKKEFFRSTYGSRKGLLDVALNTGNSGYLSRKLIFSMINLELSEDVKDCGTTDYLEVFIDNEQKAKSFLFRYYLNDDNKLKRITKKNYKTFIGKMIKVRSPIFCKSNQICHKCYGDLKKYLNTKHIGVIAAQAFGERGTQLTLRTFHFSGSASFGKGDKQDDKQEDIINDLSSVNKLLHNFEDTNYKEILNNLYKIYCRDAFAFHIHFECLVSQLMWVDNIKWRLTKNRDEKNIEYKSILYIPKLESWLLSLGFSNPKQSILNGILNEDNYSGILNDILEGKVISQ